jgi:hypothetical protein
VGAHLDGQPGHAPETGPCRPASFTGFNIEAVRQQLESIQNMQLINPIRLFIKVLKRSHIVQSLLNWLIYIFFPGMFMLPLFLSISSSSA